MGKWKKITVFIAAAVVCLSIGACSKQEKLSAEEVVNVVVTAYQQGDYEKIKPYIAEDNKLHILFAALDAENATGMDKVYQQVHALSKNLTFTTEAVEESGQSQSVKVTIHTKDITEQIPKTMSEAIVSQVEKDDGSFSDLPAWLLTGIKEGDSRDKEITVHVTTENGKTTIEDNGDNLSFFWELTAGFYYYMDMKMTTCTEPGHTYEIASAGDKIIGMIEVSEMAEDTAAVTEEAIKAFEDVFVGVSGVSVRMQPKGSDTLSLRVGVNFDKANSWDLEKLGIIDEQIAAGSMEYLSLLTTVKSFEASGMTCVTNDFGASEVFAQNKK